jgi:uncharacterized protein (DUF1501 family)
MEISRRFLLQASLLGVAGLATPFRLAYAQERTGAKLVVIILRGAMDGLAAVVPYGDAGYVAARGGLAMDPRKDGLLDLDGFFALHPSLKGMHGLYQQRELLLMHAAATPYRDRSHFDGQDVLENGMTQKLSARSGWLNRALHQGGADKAMAVSANVPLIIEGEVPVQSWSFSALPPVNESFYDRLQLMYGQDGLLMEALSEGEAASMLADGIDAKGNDLAAQAKAAAGFLKEAGGPDIAVLERTGWDTHANQGKAQGQLAQRLAELDKAVLQLKSELGPVWQKTAVLVMTEFGRTVMMNGTGGSDHGTGSVAFLAGGAVQGGRMAGVWPGLDKTQQYEGRDLAPVNDLRQLSAAVLSGLFAMAQPQLESRIFPGLRYRPPAEGIIQV